MSDQVYSLEHPIVFVFDYSDKSVTVPEYDERFVTAANSGCVSIRVSSYLDGGVKIRLVKAPERSNDKTAPVKVYEGRICAPSRSVSLVSSLNEELARVELESEEASICVFVDDETLPAEVSIVVSR